MHTVLSASVSFCKRRRLRRETLNALISSNWLKNGQNHQIGRAIPETDIFGFTSFVLFFRSVSVESDM